MCENFNLKLSFSTFQNILKQIKCSLTFFQKYLNEATAASATLFEEQRAQIAETHSSCSTIKFKFGLNFF